MTVLACSGHLLVDLPIFFGPVAVLGGWMALTVRKDRRRRAGKAAAKVGVGVS